MLRCSLLANLALAADYIDAFMKPYQSELGTGLGASHEGQTGSNGYAQIVQVQVGGQLMKMVIDTKANEMLVISTECTSCDVGIGQQKWDKSDPNNVTVGEPSDEINESYSYLSDLSYKKTYLSGRYYETQVCAAGYDNCGNNLKVFVVEDASPAMEIPYQGVIGFGLYEALGDVKENNVLTQLVERQYIASPTVGVFTGTNSSVESSQIRLGGSNKGLWASGWNNPVWFETSGSNEWTIDVQQLKFWGIDFSAYDTEVLLNPGYEFIAVPF